MIVATDDMRIVDAVAGFGGNATLTSAKATCGTDRLAEVVSRSEAGGYRAYINVQGDEPLIRPEDIATLIEVIDNPGADVATLYHEISFDEASSPTAVKVVVGHSGQCLYFSRSRIPFDRDPEVPPATFKKHVGLYAFKPGALMRWVSLSEGALERREKLEQLRLLEAGLTIFAAEIPPTGPGVDTPESLAAVRLLMEGQAATSPVPRPSCTWGQVAALVMDVDGVLTDGGLEYDASAGLSKSFHARDGLGISMLQAAGVKVGILTGRSDPATQARVAALNIPYACLLHGRHDKRQGLAELAEHMNVDVSRVAYVGDDVIDLGALEVAGASACPVDAHPAVLKACTWVSTRPGGRGAVRELAELILRAKGLGDALSSGAGFEALMLRKRAAQ